MTLPEESGNKDSPQPAIGIDIGGTKIASGLVDPGGRIVALRRTPTPAAADGLLAAVTAECARLLRIAPEARGIGVGTGGIVDVERGTIVQASDLLTGWAGTPLADLLEQRFGLPVRVDNDGNTFALAEHTLGAGRGHSEGIYVAIGTGIGGGIVLGGELRRGSRQVAGEFGHLTYPTDRRCSCGRPGHLEAVASGSSLARIYAELTGGPVVPLQEVAHRAAMADSVAGEVLDEGARALGRSLAGVLLALDVPYLVLGGGVASGLGSAYLDAVREAVRSTLPHQLEVTVAPAALGATASVVGATLLADRGA